MTREPDLLVVGASARAASFSASRAGFYPAWIDQFADFDLQRNFPGQKVNASRYPQGIVDLASSLHPMPFVYTGAMENHLDVLQQLQARHKLLGNSAQVCRAVRDPQLLTRCWEKAGIVHPQTLAAGSKAPPGNWLLKPLHGSGGQGIRSFNHETVQKGDAFYLQQYLNGESRAGVFIGNGTACSLVGVTRQLVGESFLNAGKYSYCGSVGPLDIDQAEKEQWQAMGTALCQSFSLEGIFCVDAIKARGDIYPVEVNPRYSASVEVLERALDLPLLRFHREACEGEINFRLQAARNIMAKAYLFADNRLRSPREVSRIYEDTGGSKESADIPMPGTLIETGHPVMTIFTAAVTVDAALEELKTKAALYYGHFERL